MLSILITHYKTLPLLKLCLASIREHAASVEPKEILVLDSAAEENTREMLAEQFPEVRYVPFRENVGYARLVNGGLTLARGEYILVAHPDLVFRPGAVEKLIEVLRLKPEAGVAAPRLKSFNGKALETCFRFYTLAAIVGRRTFFKYLPAVRKAVERFSMRDVDFKAADVWPVGWVQGSCLMVRREALERVGILDERFFMYFEDVDWCRRFWENGYAVLYVPAAEVLHWNIQSSRRFGGVLDLMVNKYTRIHLVSALKYFLKHGFIQPTFGA